MALKSFLTDPEQRAGGEAHGEDLDEKDYALLRAYIANGTVTLHELYAKVGDVFGDRLEEIHKPGARGEMRSCIRNVCRRSAEFLDGTPVKLLIHNYHKRIQPRGTHSGSRRG